MGRTGSRLTPIVGLGLAAIVATSLVTLSLVAQRVDVNPHLAAPVVPKRVIVGEAAPPIELPGPGESSGQPKSNGPGVGEPGPNLVAEAPPANQVLGNQISAPGVGEPVTSAAPPQEQPQPTPHPSPSGGPSGDGGGGRNGGDGDDEGDHGRVADRPRGHAYGHFKKHGRGGKPFAGVEDEQEVLPPGQAKKLGLVTRKEDDEFEHEAHGKALGHLKDHAESAVQNDDDGDDHSHQNGHGHDDGHSNGRGHHHD